MYSVFGYIFKVATLYLIPRLWRQPIALGGPIASRIPQSLEAAARAPYNNIVLEDNIY